MFAAKGFSYNDAQQTGFSSVQLVHRGKLDSSSLTGTMTQVLISH